MKAGIYGAAGYTGLELIGILKKHPELEISFATSDSHAGQSYQGVKFTPATEADASKVEMVFLCTPHGVSAPLAARSLDAGAKVVDLSADLRLNTPESYAKWYGHAHPVPALLPSPYGLPELNRSNILNQNCIANPGCYPTTTLLALAPLAKTGAIQSGVPLIVDAKSGVSGAGRQPKVEYLFAELYGDFKPYNVGRKHRHVGEIEQELHALHPNLGTLIFSPHLLPIERGLLATCYVPLADGWTLDKARQLFETAYAEEPLVNVLPAGETASIKAVANTNGAVISLHAATENLMIVVSAIDNLRKGAASQAVQNANLILNLPETLGLL